MSASVPGHSKRSQHPFCPSSTPAFSDIKEEVIHISVFLKGNFIFKMTKCLENTYPLNHIVSSVEDGDTQFEGCSHHWSSLT